jgi:hypothetical protein
MARAKKEQKPMYATVAIMNGMRVYCRFSTDLEMLIHDAETIYTGIIAIEEAHAGKPPVWERKEEAA